MLNEKRIEEAEKNIKRYLAESLLKKQSNKTAEEMYIKNSDLSLETAARILKLESDNYKPYLWVIVTSYYAMFYIANAILLRLGYTVGEKISHKVTADALIVFVRDKLKKEVLEGYEELKDEALEIASSKADNLIESFDFERTKRSKFQYKMDEDVKKAKALTSLERAKSFVFEIKKILRK